MTAPVSGPDTAARHWPTGDDANLPPGRIVASIGALPDWLMGASDAQARTPFVSASWYQLLADTALRPGQRLNWLAGIDDATGQPSATVLPVVVQDGLLGTARQMTGLTSCYHPGFEPVMVGPESAGTLAGVLQALSPLARSAGVLTFAPMSRLPDGFHRQLSAQLRGSGLLVDYFRYGMNWSKDLGNASYAQYLAQLPSRLRHTLVRSQRRLSTRYTLQIQTDAVADSGLDAAIETFQQVYQLSWKRPEPFPDFIPALCRMAAAKGWLRLGILRLDGQAVAAQLWLIHRQTAYIYKLAHNEAFSRLSVGTTLTAAMIQAALERDGCTRLDFCTGDDAYKRDWMDCQQELVGVVAFNPRTLHGLLAAGRHFGGKLLRRLRVRSS